MSFYLDKYCIEKKDDIQGNVIFIKEFKNWLNNNRNILFCVGDNGIGRTSICELLMKENNYDIYHYCDISYDKNVNDHIKNYFQNTSIKNYFKKEKKVLFIDDLDTYKSNIFKNILNIYNQFINNKILIKIICIIHKNSFNKFKEYTNNKIIDIIWFNKPTYNQVYKYIINIIDNENIELYKDSLDKLKNFILRFNCNLKTILLNLEIFLDNIKNKEINNKEYYNDNLIELSFEKNIFEKSELLFKKKLEIIDIDYIDKNTNSNLFTMIIYDNLINIIELYYKQFEKVLNKYLENNKNKKIINEKKLINCLLNKENKNNIIKKIYRKILVYYCFTDKIEEYLYKQNIENNFIFLKYINFVKIFVINNYIIKFKNINLDNIKNLKLENHLFNINLSKNIKFTNMLIENNQNIIFNRKKIQFLNQNILKFNENDILFIDFINLYLINLKLYIDLGNNDNLEKQLKKYKKLKKKEIKDFKNKIFLKLIKNFKYGKIETKIFDLVVKYNQEFNILTDKNILYIKKIL
jgi:hypothetical protein